VENKVRIWYDQEGDYLEVLFQRKKGYFRETEIDAVMEKVDDEGNVIPDFCAKMPGDQTSLAHLNNRGRMLGTAPRGGVPCRPSSA
jgi:hypothetical protein